MNLLVDPIQQRFNPAFNIKDLTSKQMDRLCDGIEMLEGIFHSSQSTTLPMIFRFVMKFLQPIASLLARVNIEGNVAVAALRLFELISSKADLTEEWAVGERKRTEVPIGELLTNYKRWSDGKSNLFRSRDADNEIPMALWTRMSLLLMFVIFQICWLI
jgi:hypothetical protein